MIVKPGFLSSDKAKAIVLLSGGCDSATVLFDAVYSFPEIIVLSFNYGQRHVKELQCAKKLVSIVSKKTHVKILGHEILNVGQLIKAPLTGVGKIPNQNENKQAVTVVPGRNTLFLTLAASLAEREKANYIIIGAVRDDWKSYPDCRPKYFRSIERSLRLGVRREITLYIPFLKYWKKAIIKYGAQVLKVPYEYTWTCYLGGKKPCGKCDACVERMNSFAANNLKDPACYQV